MTEPTPGPWYVSDEFVDDYGCRSFDVGPIADNPRRAQYEDAICTVYGDNHDGQANARLIAAAPETAAELERACEDIAELVGELRRVTASARMLSGETSDPGTEALAAIYCAEQCLAKHARAETSHGD